MAQRGLLFIAAAAIVSIALTAAAAHADSEPTLRPSELGVPYDMVSLPLLFTSPAERRSRSYKATTVLQVDGKLLDGEADFLVRVQAKRSAFLFVKVRF